MARTVTIDESPRGEALTRTARDPAFEPGLIPTSTMFSWNISGPTRGAKLRPRCLVDHTVG